MTTISTTLQELTTAKQDIKTALINKGVTPTGGLSTYADAINRISSGSATGSFDFSELGYDDDTNNILNADIQSDIDYSASIKDKLGDSTSADRLYYNDTKLVYAPYFDTSNVTDMSLMFDGCTSLNIVPKYNTSNVTDMSQMFSDCSSLTTIPLFDTSKVTSMSHMFQYCSKLTSVPQFDTSNVTNMNSMFYDCKYLTTIPQFDTSNVTNMNSMFYDCKYLTTIPQFDTSKVTNMNSMFYGCNSLTTIPLLDFGKCGGFSQWFGLSYDYALKNIGGFKDLGKVKTMVNSTSSLPYGITRESVLNIINNLYDRASADYPVITLPLGSSNLAKLTDEEKAIATNKGWTLT